MVAKYRPLARIIAVTHDELIANQLCLLWGVNPLVSPHNQDTDTMVSESVAAALEADLISNGDLVLLTSGIRAGVPGSTNMMQIITVGDILAEGTSVGKKSVFGRAVVALSPEEADLQMNQGDILITKTLDSEFAQAVQKASGLITEEGGLTSPAVIYGLSLNIPVMVGVNNITSILKTGQEITLDRYGRIYRGRVRKNN
jgi:pyruvate kinase